MTDKQTEKVQRTLATDPSGDLTKREHFAASVAQGLAAKMTLSSPDDYRQLAEASTRIADALVSALNVGLELPPPTVAERRALKLAEEEEAERVEKERREAERADKRR